jgi:hypothetical protein
MSKPKVEEIVTSEEEIALIQLERLKQISRDRLLTTDEVKMYDLLVKNLRLIKDKPDVINTTYVRISDKSDKELIDIATKPEMIEKKDE